MFYRGMPPYIRVYTADGHGYLDHDIGVLDLVVAIDDEQAMLRQCADQRRGILGYHAGARPEIRRLLRD